MMAYMKTCLQYVIKTTISQSFSILHVFIAYMNGIFGQTSTEIPGKTRGNNSRCFCESIKSTLGVAVQSVVFPVRCLCRSNRFMEEIVFAWRWKINFMAINLTSRAHCNDVLNISTAKLWFLWSFVTSLIRKADLNWRKDESLSLFVFLKYNVLIHQLIPSWWESVQHAKFGKHQVMGWHSMRFRWTIILCADNGRWQRN